MSRASFACRPPLVAGLTLAIVLTAAGCAGKGAPTPASPAPPVPNAATPPPVEKKHKPADSRASGTEETAPPVEQPVGPPAPRPAAGYDRRVEPLAGVDASALRGRRIVIDPGHGGRFPGSVGVNGLTEAEVNLGVALHLWGLLVDAGAEVMLTRTADRDFCTPTDSSLRGDLERRIARANAFDPDIFLSIHHNADAGGRHDRNETQTYFKLADPRASVDLANAIHAHLKANLAITVERLMPGNYFVLRSSAGPAVLGESSYLTNPEVEAKLALAAKQRLEAEAYFLGLADYFRQGVPRILATRVLPAMDAAAGAGATPGASAAPDTRDASERPWLVATIDRDPGAVELTVDSVLVDSAQVVRRPGGELRWRPAEPFTDGKHTSGWTVRAVGGNWSKTARDTFAIDLPIARVAFEVDPKSGLAPGQFAALSFSALDRHGRPVADTLAVGFSTRVGAVVVDSLAPRTGAPGVARGYARITGGSLAAIEAEVKSPAMGIELQNREVTSVLAIAPTLTTGFVRDPNGAPIANATVRPDSVADGDVVPTAQTNQDGWFVWPGTGQTLRADAPGYVAASPATLGPAGSRAPPAPTLRLVAVAGGALLGKRIALDPLGDDSDTLDVMADSILMRSRPDSLTRVRQALFESDADLRVARALREYLEAAGASVMLTRDRPESLTTVDRLRRVEGFAPDRVIVLGHRGGSNGVTAGHYFSSAGGKALAGRIVKRYDARGAATSTRVLESADYVVQQTGAVAVLVHGPNPEPLYVDRTRGARLLRGEAYAIYLALAEDLGADTKQFGTVRVRVTHQGGGVGGVPVRLDDRWMLITNNQGEAVFDGLPNGARLSIAAGDAPAIVRARVTTPAARTIELDFGPAPSAR